MPKRRWLHRERNLAVRRSAVSGSSTRRSTRASYGASDALLDRERREIAEESRAAVRFGILAGPHGPIEPTARGIRTARHHVHLPGHVEERAAHDELAELQSIRVDAARKARALDRQRFRVRTRAEAKRLHGGAADADVYGQVDGLGQPVGLARRGGLLRGEPDDVHAAEIEPLDVDGSIEQRPRLPARLDTLDAQLERWRLHHDPTKNDGSGEPALTVGIETPAGNSGATRCQTNCRLERTAQSSTPAETSSAAS
jgi:hypothetical protein